VGLDLDPTAGQTPLVDDERDGLLITTITTRGQLDEFEQLGVEQAVTWTMSVRPDTDRILTEGFLKELHGRMFREVWQWAGEYRRTMKNIGVEPHQIPIEIRNLVDDCRYWIDHGTFGEDEVCVRFSHRLVSVHPFANGNGRHSRLMADTLVKFGLGRSPFSWGSTNLTTPGAARAAYLSALHAADQGDYAPLVEFARR
jgi:Fic-DOC domain mobile mystery protein B